MLVDLRSKSITGREAQELLDTVGLTVNKNAIPFDPQPPNIASGIRIGTPAVTTRGLNEADMVQIAEIIDYTWPTAITRTNWNGPGPRWPVCATVIPCIRKGLCTGGRCGDMRSKTCGDGEAPEKTFASGKGVDRPRRLSSKEVSSGLQETSAAASRPDWDEYFMEIARVVASRSTCLRRSVGALIVKDTRILASGYNGAPAGLRHCLETGCLREERGFRRVSATNCAGACMRNRTP